MTQQTDQDEMERIETDEEQEEEEQEDEDTEEMLLEEADSEERVRLIADAADSLRASDILVLDLRDLTIIADFFLICTGKSSIQIRSIADRIEERMREHGYRKLRIKGYQEATWILLDYGDVVAHVMAAEQRAFYNLEGFWSAAPQIELGLIAEPTTLAGSIATQPGVQG